MIGRRNWIPPLVAAGLALSSAGAMAQNVGPDEAVDAYGMIAQPLELTSGQKRAIYEAVLRQTTRVTTTHIQPAVGAPVSPSVRLSELPDQAAVEPWAQFLKYAMVEDEVVVVDPFSMRVVDVIRGGSRP